MRELGLILGYIAISIGLMLLIAPRALVQLGEQTNKLYNIDGLIYRNRLAVGIFLILASIYMVYTTI